MRFSVLLSSLLLAFVTACGDGTGTLRLVAGDSGAKALRQALASREASDFDEIRLNVVSIRARMKDDGWQELLRDEDRPFVLDLSRLLGGESVPLAEGEVPAGTLTELRFVLDEAQPGYAIAAGSDSRISVRVPSGTTSGLKLKGAAIEILEGEVRELSVDFDVDASLKDEADGLRLRPVIRLRGVETEADAG